MLQVRGTTVNVDYHKKKTRELAASLFEVKLPIAYVKLHRITRTGLKQDHTLYIYYSWVLKLILKIIFSGL